MKYRSIVVLTGAGISAESGLKTFRDAGGLWEGHRVEDVASPEGFERDPELVYEFYNQRRKQLLSGDVHPNNAHIALAEFEAKYQGRFNIVTQNVDNLHEQAGSKSIFHIHGQLLQARCTHCESVIPWSGDLDKHSRTDLCCKADKPLRPHIVWFGEMPIYMNHIYNELQYCDLFVSIGTSGNVYPAAGFVNATPDYCHKVEINLEKTVIGNNFDESITGKASEIVKEFFESL